MSPGAPSETVQRILQQQREEEGLLREQQTLLQTKLLHQYDSYIRDVRTAQAEPTVQMQVVSGQVTVSSSAPALVTAYDVPEVIPSYSHVYTANHGGFVTGGLYLTFQNDTAGK